MEIGWNAMGGGGRGILLSGMFSFGDLFMGCLLV